MKNIIDIKAITAGFAIAIGGIAYLISGSPWVFPIGLFIICYFNLHLFTGKVPYAKSYTEIPTLIKILLWNIISAILIGIICHYSFPAIVAQALTIVQTKLNLPYWILILKAIFCNIMIYIAVDIYKNNNNPIIQLFGLEFATAIFVLCGFEHCIANAFYIGCANLLNQKSILFLLINAVGNACGGIIGCKMLRKEKE